MLSTLQRTLVVGGSLACGLAVAQGQGPPPGSDRVTPWPDAVVAESLKVLATLDSVVRRDNKNADAWHRRGMVSWGLMYRSRIGPPYRGLDWTRLGRQADTSLRIAAQLAPENARYALHLAQYYLGSGQTTMRVQAYSMVNRALESAREGADTALLVDALIEQGRIEWRRYDAGAYEMRVDFPSYCTFPGGALWREAEQWTSTEEVLKAYRNAFAQCTQPIHRERPSERDYDEAESRFREAYALSRGARAFRELAMLMVDHERWRELRPLARDYVTRSPNDGWGWMALALADHRGRGTGAEAFFDTALARLDASERGRLSAFQRILRPADTMAFLRKPEDTRVAQARTHWRNADPLWLRSGDDPRTEFLARIAYAEFRWTVEELGARGADSDRGETYIRYGPPTAIGVLRGAITFTMWDYRSGLFFIFEGAPTYGTARYPHAFAQTVGDITNTTPATWDNLTRGDVLDVAVRTARFRTDGDSIDLYLAAHAPVREMRRSSGTTSPVTAGFWLFGGRTPEIVDTTSRYAGDGTAAWINRVAPATYTYRVEAMVAGAVDAARAVDSIRIGDDTTGFRVRGFGISDLLLASRIEPRGTPARWRDFEVVPLVTQASASGELALIWENYDLTARDGQAQYTVTLSIEAQRGVAGRVLAEIVGALANVAGVSRRDDRVTFTWDRTTPHSRAVVDHIAVSLRDTPPGDYRVTLEVMDRATGRKTSRATSVSVAQ
jgi:GWxTD domain-containing protein